jgi:hypothetical protein
MTRIRIGRLLVVPLLIGLTALPALAQKPGQTASQFYLSYRTAFDKAKSIDDLKPFMSKETLDQIDATPAAERSKMFEMIKMMGALTGVKVLKEAPGPKGATLTVEGIDSDKKKATGTVEIVKENGAWKLGGESWKS